MGIHFKKRLDLSSTSEKMPPRASQRKRPMFRWMFIVLIVSIPFMYLLSQLLQEYVFVKFPGYISYNKIVIRSPVNGYVKKLNVGLSQVLKSGETIMTFTSPELELKLNYLHQEQQLVEQSLIFFKSNDEKVIMKALKQTAIDIKQTKKVYEQFLTYKEDGTIVSLQLEQARLNWSNAKKLYYSLQTQMIRLRNDRIHKTEVFYRRKLAEINKDIKVSEALLKNLTIKAILPSKVIELETYQSEFVPEGRKLIILSTNENLHVVGFVLAKYAKDIKKGLEVTVHFSDNTTTKGTIVKCPNFARRLPVHYVNPIAERSNRIVIIIKFKKNSLDRAYVFGEPVKISL